MTTDSRAQLIKAQWQPLCVIAGCCMAPGAIIAIADPPGIVSVSILLVAAAIAVAVVLPRMQAVTTAARAIRQRAADLDVALMPEGGDEAITLDRNVALLCAALRRASHSLSESSGTSSQQVEDLVRELADAHAALDRVSRLSAIGEMAAGVAHEISQPLTTLSMTLDRLSMDEAEQILIDRADLDSMSDMIQRIRGIADQLRTISRQGNDSKRELVTPRHVVDQALKVLEAHLRINDVALHLDVPEDLPKVYVNSQELQQVLINLASNAIDAMASIEGKRLTIRSMTDNERVTLSVTDNGHGVPPEILDNIFTSFFTTKDPGKGTGLGLSICKRIIDRYGGRIAVSPTKVRGTTFVIELPITQRALGELQREEASSPS